MVKEADIPPSTQSSAGRNKPGLPVGGNLAVKCPKCKELLVGRDWEKNLKVCSRCNFHFKLSAYERIDLLTDPDSFVETDQNITAADPLQFAIPLQVYARKVEEERQNVHMNEGVVIGQATIEGLPLELAIMDFRFIGGSMGSAIGEKITRAIEAATAKRIPLLIASASGGARMQESFYSLMQMAKTSAALAKLGEAHIPFFSLLTDPTTGGVTASFAMLGDVILAEPGALICFAGPRVIEGFMHIKLPEGAVTSEFVLQHGMIDTIVHRRDLRQTLAKLLQLYSTPANEGFASLAAADGQAGSKK